jgi:hypothetical protein
VGGLSRKRYTQCVEHNRHALAGAGEDRKGGYNGGMLCAMALKSANGRQTTTLYLPPACAAATGRALKSAGKRIHTHGGGGVGAFGKLSARGALGFGSLYIWHPAAIWRRGVPPARSSLLRSRRPSG